MGMVASGCAEKKQPAVAQDPQSTNLESLAPDEPEITDARDEPVWTDAEGQPLPEDSYAPEAPAQPRVHVVKRGDTLYSLARQYYNDQTQWRRIWHANRERIADPNRVRVGTSLIIP